MVIPGNVQLAGVISVVTVNPVTGRRQSGVSDCAETVMTAENARMAAMAMRVSMAGIL